jgi:hypothetical protein
LPEKQLQKEKDWIDLFKKQALHDKNQKNQYVLKIHAILNAKVPRSRLITNIRSPYDVCASFYQFMKCDVDSAIRVASGLPKLIENYKKIFEDNLFIVRYEDIENHPNKLIQELAEFLDVQLDENIAQNITDKYTKDRVKKIISDNDRSLSDRISKKQQIDAKEIVVLGKDNYRSFDLDTGFQTGHVSQRKTGEWRHAFTKAEADKIIEALDGAACDLGYSSEK